MLPVSSHSVTPGDTVTLGVRPENINITDKDKGHVSVNLDVTEQLGSDTFHYVKTQENENITIRADRKNNVNYSENIGLNFELSKCHVFNENGKTLEKTAL